MAMTTGVDQRPARLQTEVTAVANPGSPVWSDGADAAALRLSVVVPVFNESENLAPLVEEIETAIGGLAIAPDAAEIVLVDDASTDDSRERMHALASSRPLVRIVEHSRNAGQSAAMASGFRRARGAIVVTLDADRQNDPVSIPALVRALDDPSVDCATGVRTERHDAASKRLSSRVANRFRNAVVGERVTDAGCCFRAIRRECLGELPVFNGMHRFIPSILRMQGCTVVEVPVAHRPRVAGVSKYGVHDRLWRGLRDCFAMRWYSRRAVPLRRVREVVPAERAGIDA